jgi:hypothetical protein
MFLSSVLSGALALAVVSGQAATAETTVAVQQSIMLHDAVRQGKVKVEVKSLGRPSGPGVRVEVERLTPGELRVEVAPGTVLINGQNAEQNVTVGQLKGEFTGENKYKPGRVMVLADARRHAFLLDVYCLDYQKHTPRLNGKLALAALDQRAARILTPPQGVQPSVGAVQIAIWMDRAGISVEQASKRFPGKITAVDVQVARQLLAHAEQQGVASVPASMPASVRVHVTRLFSADPATRQKAAEALGSLGVAALPAIPYLVENVLDVSTDKPLPPSVVRVDVQVESVADMLARLRIPALDPLIALLRDGSLPAGADAAAALEKMAESEWGGLESLLGSGSTVTDALVDRWLALLGSDRPAARERAARFLGRSGSQRAVEPLIKMLEDDNEQVRAAAAESLQQITNQNFGPDVAKWRDWFKNR